jgi:hypothetical protein
MSGHDNINECAAVSAGLTNAGPIAILRVGPKLLCRERKKKTKILVCKRKFGLKITMVLFLSLSLYFN